MRHSLPMKPMLTLNLLKYTKIDSNFQSSCLTPEWQNYSHAPYSFQLY